MASPHPSSAPSPPAAATGFKGFLVRWGRRVWWLHSFYALGLGTFVMAYAQKEFAHAQWLGVFLVGIWLLLLVIFRVFGSGSARKLESAGGKLGYYTMTYVLKNCYQGMLFFCLPFYWRSTTLDHQNAGFLGLLALAALLSTIDVVFDKVLMRWRATASVFYAISLFAALNLVIPALFPQTRSLYNLLAAAGGTILAFWALHAQLARFKSPWVFASFVVSIGVGVGLAYVGRRAIPPVPLYAVSGGVGPRLLDDGRLAVEVSRVHRSAFLELHAVSEVAAPGGGDDRLHHAWYLEGTRVWGSAQTTRFERLEGKTIRLRSELPASAVPKAAAGHWRVDVETEDGQLAGRVRFEVVE
jgi:hypothetical protein